MIRLAKILKAAAYSIRENFLIELHNYILWIIASFAFGIGFYFCLYAEPSLKLISLLASIALAILLLTWRYQTARLFLLPIAFFLFGLNAAAWRAQLVSCPKIIETIPKAKVYGFVEKLYPADQK